MQGPLAAVAAKPGRPRVVNETERRGLLLDTAERVFRSRGYHAATMSNIAMAAGMSKRTLYQVFDSKVALFDALLVDRLSVFMAAPVVDDLPVEENFAELMARLGLDMLSDQRVALVRMIISESVTSPELGAALRRHHATVGMRTLVAWAADQHARGQLEFELSEETADVLFGMVMSHHLFNSLLSLAPIPGREALRTHARWVLQIFRFGLGSDAARHARRAVEG